MKAVILAAGASSRMRPLTDGTAKCMVPVAGLPMLRRALDTLLGAGVRELVVVTGYCEDQVRGAVRSWYPDLPVAFFSNPDYATHNNGYSLLVARQALDGADFLLLDGDVVFAQSVIDVLLASPHPDGVALRRAPDLGDEEMKVECGPDGTVQIISKAIDVRRAEGEAVGITRISAASSRDLMQTLERRIVGQGRIGDCYEDAFQDMIGRGARFHTVTIEGFCADVDTPEDRDDVERQVLALGWPRSAATG